MSANTLPQQPGFQTSASIKTYLESLTVSTFNAINTRTYDSHPSTRFFSPSFRSEPDYYLTAASTATSEPITHNLAQHFSNLRAIATAYPQHRVDASNVVAHVNLRARYADVYARVAVHGIPPGVVRDGVCVMEWRFVEGWWLCVKYTGIRGMMHDRGS